MKRSLFEHEQSKENAKFLYRQAWTNPEAFQNLYSVRFVSKAQISNIKSKFSRWSRAAACIGSSLLAFFSFKTLWQICKYNSSCYLFIDVCTRSSSIEMLPKLSFIKTSFLFSAAAGILIFAITSRVLDNFRLLRLSPNKERCSLIHRHIPTDLSNVRDA